MMAETATVRPDIDIENDLHELVTRYKPLMHDRRNYRFVVEDGHVTVVGYVKGKPTYEYLRDHAPNVRGVKSVNLEKFYNDDDLRLDVGQVLPMGIYVRMEYGAAILSGRLPEGMTAEDIMRQVATVPGIRRVLTSFG